jgi:hypothetical protein
MTRIYDPADWDDDDERRDELEGAIAVLAWRERKPQDVATLIEAGDGRLELLAGADRDELDEVGGEAAVALGYLAGLALTLRQALRRHHGGAHVVRADALAAARERRRRAREEESDPDLTA